MGLSPSVLHGLLHAEDPVASSQDKGKGRELDGSDGEGEETLEPTNAYAQVNESRPKAVYELTKDGDRIEPRLRLWLASSEPTAGSSKHARIVEAGSEDDGEASEMEDVSHKSPVEQGSGRDSPHGSAERYIQPPCYSRILFSYAYKRYSKPPRACGCRRHKW